METCEEKNGPRRGLYLPSWFWTVREETSGIIVILLFRKSLPPLNFRASGSAAFMRK
jgi:hypothetical protein